MSQQGEGAAQCRVRGAAHDCAAPHGLRRLSDSASVGCNHAIGCDTGVMDPHTTDRSAVLAGCDALDGTGGSAVIDRDVVVVSGPDAGRFLQGQLSQEVVAMTSPSAWTFLLSPSGKVDAWLCLHRLDAEHYVLEVESGWGQAVADRLRRFLLRTDATIEGPESRTVLQRRWGHGIVRLGVVDDDRPSSPVLAPGDAGVDVLLDEVVTAEAHIAPEGFVPVPLASMERHRIAHGVPRMGAELDDETIPAEAGQWVIDASVSFTKGCYTGQELVARIDSRGAQVPRPIRVLRLDGEGAAIGDEVHSSGEPGTLRGSLTSVAPRLSDDRPALALAPLARAVGVGETVTVVTGSGPVAATVVAPGEVR